MHDLEMTESLQRGFQARPTPWQGPQSIPALLQVWRDDPKMVANIAADTVLPRRAASYAPLPSLLHPNVRKACLAQGRQQLYTHQAWAFQMATSGRHLVVATPTASGKSLCYHLPVLQKIAEEPQARALYLFPTKALARDQEASLRQMLTLSELERGAIAYDGDTPQDARRKARERGGLLLTNPDMLHTAILPHHASWARFFANLRYIVIDELHVYRGVFGSHVANVLRRLKRIAAFHGSHPVFLMASATIANAQEHASRLIGAPVVCVDENGAPQNQRHIMLYNPPIRHAALGIRASVLKTAVDLTLKLIRANIPTLLFGQTRSSVEVMLKYLRDGIKADRIDPESIQSYRGGYLPQTRRKIEQALRRGDVRCVVATSALELGIDIGALSAVVCAGYPGSVAALWQRFGRGGRRGEQSLAVMVANSTATDQYFAAHPEFLLGAPVEHAQIDPENVEILVQHLKCAAFELPFDSQQGFSDLAFKSIEDALDFLADHQILHPVKQEGTTRYHWAAASYPANDVSLRQIGWDNVVIIDQDTEKTIAETDWRSAHTMLHTQAIYQHANTQYQVEKLDLENRKAFVRLVHPDYYTDAMSHLKVTPIERSQTCSTPWPGSRHIGFSLGDISVVEKVVGFKKIKYHTHENVGYGEVHLPEMQMHTSSCWFTVDAAMVRKMPFARSEVLDGLRGLAKTLHTVAVVGLMVDPRDLGYCVEDGSDEKNYSSDFEFDPALHFFDKTPGGIGLSKRLFIEKKLWFERSGYLLNKCGCDVGCPNCIGPQSDDAAHIKQIVRSILENVGVGDS